MIKFSFTLNPFCTCNIPKPRSKLQTVNGFFRPTAEEKAFSKTHPPFLFTKISALFLLFLCFLLYPFPAKHAVVSPCSRASRIINIIFNSPTILRWNVVGNGKGLECIYRNNYTEEEEKGVAVLSVDEYNDIQWLVRCPLPPTNFSSVVTLRSRGTITIADTTVVAMNYWENLAYEAVLDGNTAVVFVKGISHRQDKASDPNRFRCHFGFGNQNYILTSKALTAAQEVVRCALPKSLEIHPEKSQGIRATVSFQLPMRNHHHRTIFVPSVAKLSSSKFEINTPKHDLCVCTMLWNQADSIREWITYHSWLGVQKWFIYDNNSDDGIESVINKLDLEGFNVSRHVWPWIKTQEAGFSHCAIKAKSECNWVSFMDVDEFYYFPNLPGHGALRTLVSNHTSSPSIGELRTRCHSFGPSGLRSPPKNGVTVGYTCRLQRPERHKSIVRPEALDTTLMMWAKFYRRVATYVADWKDSQNEGSRDRAPGLGTEPIEPADWRLRFCEVWDTGLRDVVLANLDDVLPRGRYLGGIDI
ncbi:unnamed protein product [Lactuca saligna]|uniref:Glycosyltransferase family 92 protein n=1 Tax=Lactuca saligna TaxID=75948 RepID=A0AA35V4A2_LACSI|nr:unnamed protein product [Lactuca saligna]